MKYPFPLARDGWKFRVPVLTSYKNTAISIRKAAAHAGYSIEFVNYSSTEIVVRTLVTEHDATIEQAMTVHALAQTVNHPRKEPPIITLPEYPADARHRYLWITGDALYSDAAGLLWTMRPERPGEWFRENIQRIHPRVALVTPVES